MRTTRLASVALALAGAATFLAPNLGAADSGQGTAAPDTHIRDLRMGEYWHGAKITPEDLVGKVVLVDLWGS